MSATQQRAAIGSFLFEAPMPLSDPYLAKLNAAVVSRESDNQPGIAFRASLANLAATKVDAVRARLSQIAALQVRGVARTLEAGQSGAVAFVISAPIPGETIEALLRRGGPCAPSVVVQRVRAISEVLEAAGIEHGQLSSALVWIDEMGRPVLAGFSFRDPEPGADVKGLAALAFEMLTGKRFDDADFPGSAFARFDRIREALPGITARIAEVIATGTRGGYASLADLNAGFAVAIEGSVADLVEAAHQSIGAKDPVGGAMFLDLARKYDPNNQEIDIAAHRLTGGGVPSPSFSIAAPIAMPAPFDDEPAYPEDSEQARFLASLRASIPEQTVKKRKMPWIAIIAGLFGMLAIVTVLVVIIYEAA